MKANGSFLWNRVSHKLLSLAAGLAIMAAGAPGAAFAQGKSASPQKVAAPAAPVPEAARAKKAASQGGGQQEGIKVHGEWMIEVRNPDGTLASRHEFENALEPGSNLANILARGATFGRWEVIISGLLCPDSSGNPVSCNVTEPGFFNGTFPDTSTTLTISAPNSGPDAGKFILIGSTRAVFSASVFAVSTHYGECAPTTSPASPCAAFLIRPFTTKFLSANPIPVVAGQTIDVTVKISFS